MLTNVSPYGQIEILNNSAHLRKEHTCAQDAYRQQTTQAKLHAIAGSFSNVQVCIAHPWTGHNGAQGQYRYGSTLSLTSVLDGGEWLTPRPGRFTPRKESRYPIYRKLSGPKGRSGVGKTRATGIRSPDGPARSAFSNVHTYGRRPTTLCRKNTSTPSTWVSQALVAMTTTVH